MNYKINNLSIYKQRVITLFITFILLFCSINISSASEIWCWDENWEERYKCQVKNNCDNYKPENLSFETNNYFFPKKEYSNNNNVAEEEKTISNFLKALRWIKNNNNWSNNLNNYLKEKNIIQVGKIIYRENQNSIYSCAIIDIQKNTLKIVKEKLSPINKTWDLRSIIDKKIELKLNKIKLIEQQKECISPANQEEKNNVLNPKQEVLNESIYEFCKYNYYLDFLKNYYKNIENVNSTILNKTEASSIKIWKVSWLYNNIQNQILEEENHSERVFNMAFETYIDYEDNYPAHILLEVIKEDFKILRRKFHEAISPLNQVVYKISNAMSIH